MAATSPLLVVDFGVHSGAIRVLCVGTIG